MSQFRNHHEIRRTHHALSTLHQQKDSSLPSRMYGLFHTSYHLAYLEDKTALHQFLENKELYIAQLEEGNPRGIIDSLHYAMSVLIKDQPLCDFEEQQLIGYLSKKISYSIDLQDNVPKMLHKYYLGDLSLEDLLRNLEILKQEEHFLACLFVLWSEIRDSSEGSLKQVFLQVEMILTHIEQHIDTDLDICNWEYFIDTEFMSSLIAKLVELFPHATISILLNRSTKNIISDIHAKITPPLLKKIFQRQFPDQLKAKTNSSNRSFSILIGKEEKIKPLFSMFYNHPQQEHLDAIQRLDISKE